MTVLVVIGFVLVAGLLGPVVVLQRGVLPLFRTESDEAEDDCEEWCRFGRVPAR